MIRQKLPFVLGLVIFVCCLFFPSPIFATWIKYPENPVVGFGPIGNFDHDHALSPTVIHSGSGYLMWYQGENNSKNLLGFASSTDGFNWTKISELNLNSSSDQYGYHLFDPTTIIDNGVYKMWYSSASQNYANMHINYATSNDGINWSLPSINVVSPTLVWEDNSGVSSPSVIKVNNIFKMWYAGNGANGWQIGYAISNDGVTWTKNALPVLAPDELWENGDVGGPDVRQKSDGTFEMWYHGGRSIGHATSLDGVAWNKDPDNPIISSSQSFDSLATLNPFFLNENGIDYLWYSGLNSSGNFQIGVATQAATLQPTGVPTPTDIPLPSPTGAPGVHNPIVLIPGLGASWNTSDIFSCDITQSGNWGWNSDAQTKVYDMLRNSLTTSTGLVQGSSYFEYTYDWRQTLQNAGIKLNQYIETLPGISSNQKIDLVTHSFGGLVARSYIQQFPDTHKIDKLVTIGSPHKGAADAYSIWEGGKVEQLDLKNKLALSALVNICKAKSLYSLNTNREVIHSVSPSIKDILPVFNYLIDTNLLPSDTLRDANNSWLRSQNNTFVPPFNHVSLMTVSGNNKKTLDTIYVKEPSKKDADDNNWIDGEPFKSHYSQEGDGTVLRMSSLLNASDQRIYNDTHGELLNDSDALSDILMFLGYPEAKITAQTPQVEPNSALVIASNVDSPFEIYNVRNERLAKSDNGLAYVFSDVPSVYFLTFESRPSSPGLIYVGVLGKSDFWKESLKSADNSNFMIIYNPINPHPNPLTVIRP